MTLSLNTKKDLSDHPENQLKAKKIEGRGVACRITYVKGAVISSARKTAVRKLLKRRSITSWWKAISEMKTKNVLSWGLLQEPNGKTCRQLSNVPNVALLKKISKQEIDLIRENGWENSSPGLFSNLT
jgi:hypothetical protein